MPLLAGTVALITAVITLGTSSRLGLGRALAIGLAGAMLTASAIGLVLLDAQALDRVALLGSLLAALVGWIAIVAWLRRRWPVHAAPPRDTTTRLGALGLFVVLAFGVGIRLDPSPYLHGGQDQGIYVNVGHHIARTGRLRMIDPLLAGQVRGVPAELIHASHKIKPVPEDSPLAGVREGRWNAGLHVEDASEGRIVPAFFHLLPVWLAMTELEFGFASSTWALVLFAALSQLGAFAVGYRLGAGEQPEDRRRGVIVGLIAATTLALHPLDLWISTFPVTENLARAALLGAAALALEASTAERRGEPGATFMGGLAGLVFAAGAFARGSMLALAIVLAMALVLVRREAPRTRATLLACLVIGTTLAAVQAILHSWPYFFSAASNHFHVPRIKPYQGEAVAWAAAAGVAVLVGDRVVGWARRRWPTLDRTDMLVRIVATTALLAALAALAYRTLDGSDEYGPDQQVAAVLLRYVGPVGLLLALVGLFAMPWSANVRLQPWVLLASAIVLITALKEGIRYEFYYARYLVGDAIPVLVIAAAWALGEGLRRAAARWGSRRAAIGVAAVLLAWWLPGLITMMRPVYWTRDLEHAPEELAAMFEHVPDDAVLFFDSRAPHRWRGILATPAFLSFGKTVLTYPNDRVIERAVSAGTPVYMISGGWEAEDHQRWPDRGPWRTTVIDRGHYRARRAEVIEGAMPQVLTEWGGPWELHRIDPSIWRGSGAFSLHRESRFLAHEGPDRLESTVLELRWETGGFVELLFAPRALEGCSPSASLIRAELTQTLEPLPDATDSRLRFALPDPPARPIMAALAVTWNCPDEREVAWRRLSLRWERP
jgi:hypothetical protein